ncbi:MAG TPA: class I SAM-dependent methyltransferase [Actinomycetota bacterium]|nr:class I SAM-dependent methyltransferase [Actinomycetota bacterium]
MPEGPRLYAELAEWFPLITPAEEYAQEAAVYRKLFAGVGLRRGATMLELGSGGGNNASHLKKHFQMTLCDLSPDMLAVSKQLNPELEHVQGDMRTVRLGREFEAVFVHDAIDYMLTEPDLAAAIETAFVHCRPGGMALFVPDDVRETFKPRTAHGGVDAGSRGARYIEWTWDPDPNDDTYVVDFAYLLRDEDGNLRVEQDRHEIGLFSRDFWRSLLRQAGFTVKIHKADLGDELSEIFVCLKPVR